MITKLLGIEYPIVGFTPSPRVAAAISKAGGLGVLGAVRYTRVEELEEALRFLDQSGAPYGVDVVMPFKEMQGLSAFEIDDRHKRFVNDVLARHGVPELPPGAPRPEGINAWMHEFARAQVECSLDHPCALIANALGPPPPEVAAATRTPFFFAAALAGKAEHARRHVEAGADIIVAQGHEAGGHCGEVTTMVLVPEVVRAVDVPVLAAGGIGTGAQLAAAFALGASGAWLGSIWLATEEYDLEPKQPSGYSVVTEKLLAATSSDTVRSRAVSGKPARMLKTKWTEAWEGEVKPLPMPLQGMLVAEAEARIRHFQSKELLGVPVGQIVGQMNQVSSVAEVMRELVEGCRSTVLRIAHNIPPNLRGT